MLQDHPELQGMLEQVEAIAREAKDRERAQTDRLEKIHPELQDSARNLIHYRTLRNYDIRELQKQLGFMGLSRLAKAEGHTMASLSVTATILRALILGEFIEKENINLTIERAQAIVRSHTRKLLGTRTEGRRTRIMVTLPSEAANNYNLVHDMMARGMNCARINCAHDGPEAWKKMIAHVRKASKALEVHCQVAMDLAGPKIRTGELKPGPKVRRYKPQKDRYGRMVHPAEVWVGPAPHPTLELLHLPISTADLKTMEPGDSLYCRDTRHKKREFRIVEVHTDGCVAEVYRTAYLQEGSLLYKDKKFKSRPFTVGVLPAAEEPIQLVAGDTLRIHQSRELGEPARYDDKGELLQQAHISCTSEEVFEQVKEGEPILFDDGQIEGVIEHVTTGELQVKIMRTKEGGGKLRADKGINFPESQLNIRGLTLKDRKDLPFVAEYADVVNLSFVNSAADVRELIDELEALEALNKTGVILKIETQSGFNQLTEILLEGMRVYPLGVMIARGDLAIEVGWENIGRVQEEILSLCQAAHVPDIWATQVLENLAKRGIPSRAEITDAAMAQRAECVMLNKGGYILQAIQLLDSILRGMGHYQEKNAPMLPPMEAAKRSKS
jgi:pyruvate kinase